MKLPAPFFAFLFVAVSLGGAAPSSAQTTTSPKQNPSSAAGDKADQPATIPGLTIPRSNGGFLGLQIDDQSNFKLTFYNAQKKPVAPDVASATLRWVPHGKRGIDFVSLTPGEDGVSLTSPRFIQKPWMFHLFIALFAQGSNDPVENYTVDFSQ